MSKQHWTASRSPRHTGRPVTVARLRTARRPLAATLAATLLGALAVTAAPPPADAGCNVIPRTPGTFRGALGLTNRPFAGPGENLEIAVRTDDCDQASPGFLPGRLRSYVASVIFGGRDDEGRGASMIVLASSCADLASELAACEASPGIAVATCVDANQERGPRDLALVERRGERRLLLRFPDTDALVDAPHDGRTLAGPATIAVTTTDTALPCGLARTRCADAPRRPGLIACVDELYASASACGTDADDRAETFAHFTALPPANDYRTILAERGTIDTGTDAEIRFTLDTAGNALVPVDWRGALIEKTSGALTRQLRGIRTVEAFLGLAADPDTVELASIASYDLRGEKLPPLYRADSPAYQETLFGTMDVPRTIVRIPGRACSQAQACPHGRSSFRPAARAGQGGLFVVPSPDRPEERQRQACVLPAEATLGDARL